MKKTKLVSILIIAISAIIMLNILGVYEARADGGSGYIAGSICAEQNYEDVHIAKIYVFPIDKVNWANVSDYRDTSSSYGTLSGAMLSQKICETETNSDGTFSIELPAGEQYDLLIDKGGYLDYVIANVEVMPGLTTNLGEKIIQVGDINKDAVIDGSDVAGVKNATVLAFFSTQERIDNKNVYDLDEDGEIGVSDILAVNRSASEYKIRTLPIVIISNPSNIYTDEEDITYTITITKSYIQNIDLNKLSLIKTGTAEGSLKTSQSGTEITATISNITGDGEIRLKADAGFVQLQTGALSTEVTGRLFTVDNTRPEVSVEINNESGLFVNQYSETGTAIIDIIFADTNLKATYLTAKDITLLVDGVTVNPALFEELEITVLNEGVPLAGETLDGRKTLTYTIEITGIPGDGELSLIIAENMSEDETGHKNIETLPLLVEGIIIDNTNPEISYPSDEEYINTSVTPIYTDDYLAYVELIKDGMEVEDYDGEELIEEGIYELTVVDKAGNSSNITFTIDTTDPVITEPANGAYISGTVTPEWFDINFDYATLKKDSAEAIAYEGTGVTEGEDGEYIGTTEITEEGVYILTVVDKAGNSKSVTFIIDITNPEVTLTMNSGSGAFVNKAGLTGKAIIDVTFSDIYLKDTVLLSTDILEVKVGTGVDAIIYRNLTQEEKDKEIGHETDDLDLSELTITVLGSNANFDGTEVTYAVKIEGLEGDGVLAVKIAKDLAEDEAGNLNEETNLRIAEGITIDNTKPEIYNPTDGYYSGIGVDVTPTYFDKNFSHAVITRDDGNTVYEFQRYGITTHPAGIETTGLSVSPEGIYVITVFDKAGNSDFITFTIDKTTPITVIERVLGSEVLNPLYDGNLYVTSSAPMVTISVTFIDQYLFGDGTSKNPYSTKLEESDLILKVGDDTIYSALGGEDIDIYSVIDDISGPDVGVGIDEFGRPSITHTYTIKIIGLEGGGMLSVTVLEDCTEDLAGNRDLPKTQILRTIIVDNDEPEAIIRVNPEYFEQNAYEDEFVYVNKDAIVIFDVLFLDRTLFETHLTETDITLTIEDEEDTIIYRAFTDDEKNGIEPVGDNEFDIEELDIVIDGPYEYYEYEDSEEEVIKLASDRYVVTISGLEKTGLEGNGRLTVKVNANLANDKVGKYSLETDQELAIIVDNIDPVITFPSFDGYITNNASVIPLYKDECTCIDIEEHHHFYELTVKKDGVQVDRYNWLEIEHIPTLDEIGKTINQTNGTTSFYELTLLDKAGNMDTRTFTIDRTDPTVKITKNSSLNGTYVNVAQDTGTAVVDVEFERTHKYTDPTLGSVSIPLLNTTSLTEDDIIIKVGNTVVFDLKNMDGVTPDPIQYCSISITPDPLYPPQYPDTTNPAKYTVTITGLADINNVLLDGHLTLTVREDLAWTLTDDGLGRSNRETTKVFDQDTDRIIIDNKGPEITISKNSSLNGTYVNKTQATGTARVDVTFRDTYQYVDSISGTTKYVELLDSTDLQLTDIIVKVDGVPVYDLNNEEEIASVMVPAPITDCSVGINKVTTKVNGTDLVTYTLTITGLDGDGYLTVEIAEDIAKDLAGNKSDGIKKTFNNEGNVAELIKVDNTSPTVTEPPSSTTTQGTTTLNKMTNQPLTPLYSDVDFWKVEVTRDGTALWQTYNFTEGGSIATTGKTITQDGVYTITVFDRAGNTTTRTFIIDTQGPIVTMVKGEGDSIINSGTPAVVNVTFEDTYSYGPTSLLDTTSLVPANILKIEIGDTVYARDGSGNYDIATEILAGRLSINVDPSSPHAQYTNPATYEVSITGLVGDGDLYLTIAGGIAFDKGTNPNSLTRAKVGISVSNGGIEIDNTSPDVTITNIGREYVRMPRMDEDSTTILETIATIQVMFADKNLTSTNLTASDLTITVDSGTALPKGSNPNEVGVSISGPVSGNGLDAKGDPAITETYTVTLTRLPNNGNLEITVAEDVAEDIAGNKSLKATTALTHTALGIKVDNIDPTIDYPLNGGFYEESVLPIFYDLNFSNVIVVKDGVTYQTYDYNNPELVNDELLTKGLLIEDEGVYTITVLDKAGNYLTYGFIIDKQAPTVTFANIGDKHEGISYVRQGTTATIEVTFEDSYTDDSSVKTNLLDNTRLTLDDILEIRVGDKTYTKDYSGDYNIADEMEKLENPLIIVVTPDDVSPEPALTNPVTYTIEITGLIGNGNLEIKLDEGLAVDKAGNESVITDSYNENPARSLGIMIDNIDPTLAITKAGTHTYVNALRTAVVEVEFEDIYLWLDGRTDLTESDITIEIYADEYTILDITDTAEILDIIPLTGTSTTKKYAVYLTNLIGIDDEEIIDGELRITITAGIAEDFAGNKNQEKTQLTGIIVDNTKPTINYPTNGLYTNEPVELDFEDTNLDFATLQKDGEDLGKVINEAVISDDGVYILTVWDKAGNSSSTTFIIDTEGPSVSFADVSENSFVRRGTTAKVEVTFEDSYTDSEGITTALLDTTRLVADDILEIKVGSKVYGRDEFADYNIDTEIEEGRLAINIAPDIIEDDIVIPITAVNNSQTYTISITGLEENGSLEIKLKAGLAVDKATNESKEADSGNLGIIVDNKLPTVDVKNKGLSFVRQATSATLEVEFEDDYLWLDGKTTLANNDITVEIIGSVTTDVTETTGIAIQEINGTSTTKKYEVRLTNLIGNGELKLTIAEGIAEDFAGNKNLIKVVETGIIVDNTLPLIIEPLNNTDANYGITPEWFDIYFDYATLKKDSAGALAYTGEEDEETDGLYLGTTEISAEGEYILTVVDKAGNTAQASFIIDKTNPIVTMVKGAGGENADGKLYVTNQDTFVVNVTFSDKYLNSATLTNSDIMEIKVGDKVYRELGEFEETEDIEITGHVNVGTPTGVNPKTYPVTLTGLSGNGALTIKVDKDLAEDKAGNKNVVTIKTIENVVVDNVEPVITAPIPNWPEGFKTNENIIPEWFEINFSHATLSLNDGPHNSYSVNNLGSGNYTGQTLTADGKYVLTIYDKAGNNSTITMWLNRTKPVIIIHDLENEYFMEVNRDITWCDNYGDTEYKYLDPHEIDFEYLIAEATGFVDGNITDRINVNVEEVNTRVTGRYNIYFEATDKSGNFTKIARGFWVQDTQVPWIEFEEGMDEQSYAVIIQGASNVEMVGVSAHDFCDGDITNKIVLSQSRLDTSVKGITIPLTYKVADSAGNTASEVRNFKITNYPILTINTPSKMTVHNSLPGISASAVSAYDGSSISADNITIKINGVDLRDIEDPEKPEIVNPINTHILGSYTITYSVIDEDGLVTQNNQTFSVVDDVKPTLDLEPSDYDLKETLNLSDSYMVLHINETYVETGFTYSDNYDSPEDIKITITISTLTGGTKKTINSTDGKYALIENIPDLITAITADIEAEIDTSVAQVYFVEYKATDKQNNVTTHTREIVVAEYEKPTIVLNLNNTYNMEVYTVWDPAYELIIDPEDAIPSFASGIIKAVAIDYDGETVTSWVDMSEVDPEVIGTYTIYFIAEDRHGTQTIIPRTFTVRDTLAPEVTLLEPQYNNIYIEACSLETYTEEGAKAFDYYDEDNLIINTVVTRGSTTIPAVDVNVVGTYTITYSATDSSGNTGKATRTVIVRDTIPPVITVDNSNLSLPVIEVRNEIVEGKEVEVVVIPQHVLYNMTSGMMEGITVYDAVSTGLTVTDVIAKPNGINSSSPGVFNVNYEVKDTAGNIGTAVRYVRVIDITVPELHIDADNVYKMEVDTELDSHSIPTFLATAWDNVDGHILSITLINERPETIEEYPADTIVVDISNINPNVVGTYEVVFTVKDAHGNWTRQTKAFTVEDTTPPVITVHDEYNVYEMEVSTPNDLHSIPEFNVTALDFYDGEIDVVIDTSNIDPETLGIYTIYFNVKDKAGNSAMEVTRTFEVKDTTPPVIIPDEYNVYEIEVFGTIPEFSAIAEDYYDGTITNVVILTEENAEEVLSGDLTSTIIIDIREINPNIVDTYTIYFNAKDATGNDAQTVTKTFTVQDTTDPVITVEPDYIIVMKDSKIGLAEILTGVTAEDNYDGNLTSEIIADVNEVDTSVTGTVVVTYTVTDSSNNTVTAIRTYVIDDEGLVLNVDSDDIVFVEFEGEYQYPEYEITSQYTYGGNITVKIYVNGVWDEFLDVLVDTGEVGEYFVKFVATDEAGNNTSKTIRVIVGNANKPTIILDLNNVYEMEVDANVTEGPNSIPLFKATAMDSNGTPIEVVITDDINTEIVGKYTLTFTVTESIEPLVQEIIMVDFYVVDTQAPVIHLDEINIYEMTASPDPLDIPEFLVTAEDLYDGLIDEIIVVTGDEVDMDINAETGEITLTLNSVPIDITNKIIIDIRDIDYTTAGEYQIAFYAIDSSGNIATEIRVFTVTGILPAPEETIQEEEIMEEEATEEEMQEDMLEEEII